MIKVIHPGDSSIGKVETPSAIERAFKVYWIKLLLFPLGLILANLERMYALTFSSIGTCWMLQVTNFSINLFTLAKYL